MQMTRNRPMYGGKLDEMIVREGRGEDRLAADDLWWATQQLARDAKGAIAVQTILAARGFRRLMVSLHGGKASCSRESSRQAKTRPHPKGAFITQVAIPDYEF